MKTHTKAMTVSLLALAITLSSTTSTQAQNTAEVEVGVVEVGADVVQDIRATLKARIQTPEDKAKMQADAELRAKILRDQTQTEARINATSSQRMEIRDERREAVRNASTSIEQRWGIRREAAKEAFEARKAAFVRQLQLSISNLEQISSRISAKITTAEQSGRDMTEPKRLLVSADLKISDAKVAVTAVVNYTPSTTNDASSTTTVDLERPRTLGAEATRAIHEARRALQEVIVAIARNMGLRVGADGKVSATTTTEVSPAQ